MAISGSLPRKSLNHEDTKYHEGSVESISAVPTGLVRYVSNQPSAEAPDYYQPPPRGAQGKCSGVLEADSAVDDENLAGNELWGGREEQDGCGDFVSAAVALHGGLFGHAAHEGRR
jgi:hypothetical protein